MRKGAEADPPGQLLNSSIDLKGSGERDHPANSSSRKPAVWDRPAALRAIIVVTMVVIVALVAALIADGAVELRTIVIERPLPLQLCSPALMNPPRRS
ncbi:hypothetical protein KIL84_004259 [Mauremys mutica]|uniref:Uncharacterized protein n=1 Tax=Mauremys mutica TaxID=74926 RepID=A0A9D3XMM2_9SAUR|nr:hypothetical protein KIL84_004259 [Mauremys mutica]